MSSRLRMATVAISACVTTLSARAADSGLDVRTQEIEQRVLKIDVHTDVLLPESPELNYAPGHTSRTDLPNLHSGHIGAIAFAIAVGPGPGRPRVPVRPAPRRMQS